MKLTNDEFNRFIEQHANDDTAKLRMKYHGDDKGYLEAIAQIELRRKSPEKFTDATGRSMRPAILHSAVAVEQSTSATIARFHASLIAPRSNVLDMTMGMGIDSLAIAETDGCRVTAIERQSDLCEISRQNYSNIPGLEIINADSVEWLKETDRQFDCIFIDPARRDTSGNRVYNIHDCTPDVSEIMPLMLDHSPKVMIKLSPMLDVTATLRDLPSATRIYVVEERGECRELLVIAERGASTASTASNASTASDTENQTITIVNRQPIFSFTRQMETDATAAYGTPSKGDYLYEPSAATMKAAPFKLLSEQFGTTALAPNSHLYFSKLPVTLFPGKEYRVVEVLPYSSGVLKRFSRQWPAVSVAVRNFPESADRLRSRLKVRESDSLRLLATTDRSGEKLLLLLEHAGH